MDDALLQNVEQPLVLRRFIAQAVLDQEFSATFATDNPDVLSISVNVLAEAEVSPRTNGGVMVRAIKTMIA